VQDTASKVDSRFATIKSLKMDINLKKIFPYILAKEELYDIVHTSGLCFEKSCKKKKPIQAFVTLKFILSG